MWQNGNPTCSLSHISILGGGHYGHPLHFNCIWAPGTQNGLTIHLVQIPIIVSHSWPTSVCSLVSVLQESHPSPPKKKKKTHTHTKNPPAGGDRGFLVKIFSWKRDLTTSSKWHCYSSGAHGLQTEVYIFGEKMPPEGATDVEAEITFCRKSQISCMRN